MPDPWRTAPVFYVLAQAQFNPVAAMEKYIPEIQDTFRKKGFSGEFERQEFKGLRIAINPNEPMTPEFSNESRWLISDTQRRTGLLIGSNYLTLHTTEYPGHEPFLQTLIDALTAVHGIVTLDHVTRLGMRYLNGIIPAKNCRLDSYISESVLGLTIPGVEKKYGLYEGVGETRGGPLVDAAALVTRVHRMVGELGFPPDLQPFGLELLDRFRMAEPLDHALIDIDHYAQGIMPIAAGGHLEQLTHLHAGVRKAFDTITLESARETWINE